VVRKDPRLVGEIPTASFEFIPRVRLRYERGEKEGATKGRSMGVGKPDQGKKRKRVYPLWRCWPVLRRGGRRRERLPVSTGKNPVFRGELC